MSTRILSLLCVESLALVLLLVIAHILTPAPQVAQAAGEWHVCQAGSADFTTIQAAVGAAAPNDVIKVAAGVYTEGQGSYNLLITKTVHLYGGYTCNSWTTRDYTNNLTIIRPATSTISVVSLVGGFGNSANFTPTLDGFTITGGGGGNHGGGIRATDSDALIRNDVITGNVGYVYGGGIWVQRGAPLITNNRIQNNVLTSGGYGGGIALEASQAMLSQNVIAQNVVSATQGSGGGAAIYSGSNVTLAGNTIEGNIAGYPQSVSDVPQGGGILVLNSGAVLAGNVISDNIADGLNLSVGQGGGIALVDSSAQIRGGQLTANAPGVAGYGSAVSAFSSTLSLDAAYVQNNDGGGDASVAGLSSALYLQATPFTITNAILTHNHNAIAGAVYADSNSPGLLVNDTFIANSDPGSRGGALATRAPFMLVNTIIMSEDIGVKTFITVPYTLSFDDWYHDSMTAVIYTNTQPLPLDASNLFVDPQLDANTHLLPGSPLIDAGTRANAPDHDIDGQPRPMLGTSGLYKVDIGADEFPGMAQTLRDLATQPADFTLIGPGNPTDNISSTGPNDWIGYAVMGADVNGDGRADLVVGAPNLSDQFDGGPDDSGRVFALYGSGTRRLGVVDLYTTTPSLEVRSWLNQQHAGQAFASGDLDGDGKPDLIVGASGAAQFNVTGTVYVFTGGADLSGVRMLSPTMQAAYRFRSDQNTSSFGGANSLAAGHLRGRSGPDDLVVGEPNATVMGRSRAGAVYVFFGSRDLPALWDLGVLSASLTIYGPTADAHLGRVTLADVNGDGIPDLIVRSADTVYVFYGPLSPGVIDLATTPAGLMRGGLQDGRLAAGDVAGKGQADVVVGSGSQVMLLRGSDLSVRGILTGVTASALHALDWLGDGKAEIAIGEAGLNRAFVLSGTAALSGTVEILDRADWIIEGESANDQFGFSLESGDLAGDGAADLIIGSRSHEVTDHPLHFADAGAVYVLYGHVHAAPPPRTLYLPLLAR